jgi:hydrogenase maturation protein HypF
MAENGLVEPVIAVTFDGTGFGTDGTIWGGEFLVGDYRQVRRAAHLRAVGLPGGDAAVREPWRVAVAYLADAGLSPHSTWGRLVCGEGKVPRAALRTVEQMIDRRFNTPLTSSAGRLFDAVAALAGARDRVSYEGQAAMELEWLATEVPPDGAYPFDIAEAVDGEAPAAPNLIVDTRPLIRAVARDVGKGVAAALVGRRFHTAVVEIIVTVCSRLRDGTGLDAVVLSGGVFMNALLACEAAARLGAEGFHVYRHHRVPPNDGGLSLGQLAIAAVSNQ